MKQIRITRDDAGNVKFDPASIDNTETVFFTNLDPKEAHWPTTTTNQPFTTNQLGAAPSPNSSQCPVPVPQGQSLPYPFNYKCKFHPNEAGVITVFALLAADKTSLQATVGQPFNQRVVKGGKPPYSITGLFVNNISVPGSSTGPGQTLPIAQGVQLSQNGDGIWVAGTPTKAETFNFTFTVNDSMGRNLQQVQYSLKVS
jgi:hypothetical protein